jgi:hypothetical protein
MNIKQEIEGLYNAINKTNRHEIKSVTAKYQELLTYLFCNSEYSTIENSEYISILYSLIFQTRDSVNGKGEYKFAHAFIGEWIKLGYTEYGQPFKSVLDYLVNKAIQNIIYCLHEEAKPYGSWKDIKYFCNHLKEEVLPEIGEKDIAALPVFEYILFIVVEQLHYDVDIIEYGTPSLLCKWLPRETSDKFGWMAAHIATAYYPEWVNSIKNTTKNTTKNTKNTKINKIAVRKCLTHYRKMVAEINKVLQTPQINQCGQRWADIDFVKISSQTLQKQNAAFEYKDMYGEYRGENEDRMTCSANYQEYKNDYYKVEAQGLEQQHSTYLFWDEINERLSDNRYKWATKEIKKLWLLDEQVKEQEEEQAQEQEAEAEEEEQVEAEQEAEAEEEEQVEEEQVEAEEEQAEEGVEAEEEGAEQEEQVEAEEEEAEQAQAVKEEAEQEVEAEEGVEVELEEVEEQVNTPKKNTGWFGWLGWN